MAASKPAEISATELEIKRRGRRRLIGAVTLGLLAIIFLPMIFDSEPKRAGEAGKTQEIAVQIPAKDNQPPLPAPAPPVMSPTPAPAVTAPAPVPEAPKAVVDAAPKEAAPAVKEPQKDPPKPAAVAVAPAKVTDKPASKDTLKPAAKPEKADKAAKAPAVKDGFYVQLGVYTKAENADKEIARVKEAKLPVHTDTIPVKAGNATRVRVGPYATREKAEAALAQIKLAGGDGKIVPTK